MQQEANFTTRNLIVIIVITYVTIMLLNFMFNQPPLGFQYSLVKPMEDDEIYLSAFNQTGIGSVILKALAPHVGFYYGDIIVFTSGLLILTAVGIFLFTFLKTVSEKRSEALSFLVTCLFLFFNKQLLSITGFLSLNIPGLSQLFSLLREPHGNLLFRFYQPGLAILCMLMGLFALFILQNGQTSKALFVMATLMLLFAVVGVASYPWIGMAFLAYMVIEVIWQQRSLYSVTVIAANVFLLGLLFIFFRSSMNTISANDYLDRLAVVRRHIPDLPTLIPNVILLLVSFLFSKNGIGRTVIKIQLANILAVCSSFMTGYYVQPWHYLYITPLSIALLIFCFLSSSRIVMEGAAHPLIAYSFAIVICLYGGYQLSTWHISEYYMVPERQISMINNIQGRCLQAEPYFFSSEPAYWWSLPARSRCKNILYAFGLASSISNDDIAARYLAAMLHYGRYATKKEFMEDLSNHLKNLGTSDYELTRNQIKYTESDRIYTHTLTNLFNMGFNNDRSRIYIKSLFYNVDYSQQKQIIENLDSQSDIINLDLLSTFK